MATITHAKTSAKSDGGDATLVQPSDWNADHTIAWGTPTVALGTAAIIGSATSLIHSDATILAFDGTAPTTQAFGDAAATGTAAVAARRDHKHAMPGTPTTVATDTIWDAAGDLAVGSGADTASRLAKGNAGAVLAMGNSAVIWNAGTSFPASKATGDRYWRTDLGMEFYWDGTRWLSTVLHFATVSKPFSAVPLTVNESMWIQVLGGATFDVYILQLRGSTTVVTTNDGSKYWTLTLQDIASSTIDSATFNTSGDSVNTTTGHIVNVNTALTAPLGLQILCAKTSTPGGIYPLVMVTYRLIGV